MERKSKIKDRLDSSAGIFIVHCTQAWIVEGSEQPREERVSLGRERERLGSDGDGGGVEGEGLQEGGLR